MMNTRKMILRNIPRVSYYESDAEDDRMSDEDYSPSEERTIIDSDNDDNESFYDDNYESDEEYLPMKFTKPMQKSEKKIENVVILIQKDVSKKVRDRKETILRRSSRISKKNV